jgi:hypothetical protein
MRESSRAGHNSGWRCLVSIFGLLLLHTTGLSSPGRERVSCALCTTLICLGNVESTPPPLRLTPYSSLFQGGSPPPPPRAAAPSWSGLCAM